MKPILNFRVNLFACLLALCTFSLQAQQSSPAQEKPSSDKEKSTPDKSAPDKSTPTIKIPLSDPARPAMLKVNLTYGSITVKAYKGKEVLVQAIPVSASEKSRKMGYGSSNNGIVESTVNSVLESFGQQSWGGEKNRDKDKDREGLKKISNQNVPVSIEEENNIVVVRLESHRTYNAHIIIQTPVQSSVKLKTVNNGDIYVEGIHGDVEVENINGGVELKNISGSVTAHALNRKIKASFTALATDKASSFSSMNGAIDLTLPANTKANLNLKNQNGEIYSDFDIKLGIPTAKVEEAKEKGGKYRVKIDNNVQGTINGGGVEIQCKNYNADIYIRSAK